MEELATFDFVIKYRDGKNPPTDWLSRRADHWDNSVAAGAKEGFLANFLNQGLVQARPK